MLELWLHLNLKKFIQLVDEVYYSKVPETVVSYPSFKSLFIQNIFKLYLHFGKVSVYQNHFVSIMRVINIASEALF